MSATPEKSYRVTWEIDVDASSPRAAAIKAMEMMPGVRRTSIATTFVVRRQAETVGRIVDLERYVHQPAPLARCRQTACRYCGHDIENLRNARGRFPRGEWRDRGNNRTCDGRRLHAPVPEE